MANSVHGNRGKQDCGLCAHIEYTFEERPVLHKEARPTVLQSHQGHLVL